MGKQMTFGEIDPGKLSRSRFSVGWIAINATIQNSGNWCLYDHGMMVEGMIVNSSEPDRFVVSGRDYVWWPKKGKVKSGAEEYDVPSICRVGGGDSPSCSKRI